MVRYGAVPTGGWHSVLGLVLLLVPAAASAQQAYPAPGASYSAAVVSPAGATLAVFGGVAGAGTTGESASHAALRQVATRLDAVGLDRSQIVRVRAALAPNVDFGAWNTAWTTFFAGRTPPARTTVYASGLPGDASLVLDVVAMFPSSVGHPVVVDGARTTLNPNLQLVGPASNPTAVVSTRAGLFLSSGALPGRDLGDPDSLEVHIRSSLNSLGGTLANHGLRWHDVFFIRAMPTPQPDRPAPDFAAWAPVYETLGDLTSGKAPPYTLWAAPGFSASNRYSEIEVWAVPPAPAAVFATPDAITQNPLLRMSGSPRSFIANGATIAPNAELAWLSGVVAPAGTAPDEEAVVAVGIMKERVAAMGATLADVAELRVYRVAAGSDGDELAAAWNEVYGTEWNNEETNPHKPVRTNYLVGSLPGGRHVEVEAIVVLPPRTF